MVRSRAKYGNIPTVYQGRRYASKKEAERAFQLDLLKRAGEVVRWTPQPRFDFVYNGVKICTYVADFEVHWKNGAIEIEDVKGVRTDVFIIKKKLMKAFFNITVTEL